MSIEGVMASGVKWDDVVARVLENKVEPPWAPTTINLAIIPKAKRRRRKQGRQ